MHPYLIHRNDLGRSMPKGAVRHDAAANSDELFHRWTRAAVRTWQRRKMITTLESLDDWILRDIGIYRGEIRRVVDGLDDRELRMVPLAPPAKTVETDQEGFRKAA